MVIQASLHIIGQADVEPACGVLDDINVVWHMFLNTKKPWRGKLQGFEIGCGGRI